MNQNAHSTGSWSQAYPPDSTVQAPAEDAILCLACPCGAVLEPGPGAVAAAAQPVWLAGVPSSASNQFSIASCFCLGCRMLRGPLVMVTLLLNGEASSVPSVLCDCCCCCCCCCCCALSCTAGGCAGAWAQLVYAGGDAVTPAAFAVAPPVGSDEWCKLGIVDPVVCARCASVAATAAGTAAVTAGLYAAEKMSSHRSHACDEQEGVTLA
jgi:hypothetical protein